ncbi:GM24994 [Drosophila sechellia]|uniref:GM24994 n=2 Tax=Drosophila sechellia TaxID=7238 RepID=B4HIV0_DROSE|nr:GM24994 [Drosophila sechellia]
MAQFVTHIQPTLMEASQGHVPHHHGHQVGVQHSSHLPHSGHNMPSPPTHNHHHAHGHVHHTSSGGHHGGAGGHSHKQSAHHSTTSGHASKGQHHSPPSRIHSPPTEHHPDHIGHYEYFQHQHELIFHHEGANGGASHKQQTHHHPNKHEHCPTGHQSAVSCPAQGYIIGLGSGEWVGPLLI